MAGRRSYLVYAKRTARAYTHRRHIVPRPWEGTSRPCAHAFIWKCDVIRRARKPSATRNRMWAGVLLQSPRKRMRGVGLPPAPSSGQRSLNWFSALGYGLPKFTCQSEVSSRVRESSFSTQGKVESHVALESSLLYCDYNPPEKKFYVYVFTVEDVSLWSSGYHGSHED